MDDPTGRRARERLILLTYKTWRTSFGHRQMPFHRYSARDDAVRDRARACREDSSRPRCLASESWTVGRDSIADRGRFRLPCGRADRQASVVVFVFP